jgi:apolipoprotein N-acyltransferase
VWWSLEWLRAHLFSGFPWLSLGYSMTDTIWSSWAPLIGESGIGALVALTAGWLAAVLRRERLCRASTVLVAVFWLVGPLLALAVWSQPVGKPIAVSLVQPNIDQNIKWNSDHLWQIVGQLQEETEQAPPGIVIWPEAALPVFADRIQPWLAEWVRTQKAQGKWVVTGIPVREQDRYYNAVMRLTDSGLGPSVYRKRRLVPFGEYVPFQDVLRGVIAFFNLPMSNFALGPVDQPPLNIQGLPVGVAICYEMAFPALVLQQAAQSRWLLTVSNDTWFGDSWGPHQHLQMVRMRARETALPIARATNNGITAVIDERGREVARLPAFESGRLDAMIQPRVSTAPLLRFPWLHWLVPLMLLALMQPWRRTGHE